jgi:hypothetical protein
VPAALSELLGGEPDEKAVLSVCAVAGPAGGWVLVHGSLLIVPESCAESSWPQWREIEGPESTGSAPAIPPTTVIEGGSWLLGRAVLSLDEAEAWWQTHSLNAGDKLTALSLPAVGNLPPIRGRVGRPKMMLRVFPGVDSRTSSLITGLGRPAQALLWESSDEVDFPEITQVQVEAATSYLPTHDIAGIHVSPDYVAPEIATAKGLLVGRAERRAWIREGRGSGDFEHYHATLGWGPGRIDLADLEIEHVERLKRDVVMAARVRLVDLDLDEAPDAGTCLVKLPTIGRGVTHELILHSTDGELLDRSGPYPIAERIVMNMVIDGHPIEPIVHGVTDPPPGLDERLDRRERLAADISSVLENAAQTRILADRATAVDRLTAALRRARGELLVADPYFGQSAEDWRILDEVPVGVRVLTVKLAQAEDKTPIPILAGPHVRARYRKKAPIHERIYVWDGGGIAVGGSISTFGHAPVRLSRLTSAEVDHWRAVFERNWASPHFTDVPRATSDVADG